MYPLIILIAIIPLTKSSSAYCQNFDTSSSTCSLCESKYFLSYGICQLECPTGFLPSSNQICSQFSTSLQIFQTNFFETLKLSSSTVGDFKTVSENFYSYSKNLIPTGPDRGFYSHSTSNLISKSKISVSPSFTIKAYLKPISAGTIFKYSDIIKVSVVGSTISFSLLIYSQSSQNEISIKINSQVSLDSWIRLMIVSSTLNSNSILKKIQINDAVNSATSYNSEIGKRLSDFFYIGDFESIKSVEGFFYKLELWNQALSDGFGLMDVGDCPYLSFWNGVTCAECMAECGEINCVRGSDCVTCPLSSCSVCEGYGEEDCLVCENGESKPYCCDFLCLRCGVFEKCLECKDGSFLSFGICVLRLPDGYNGIENSVISALDISFMQRNWSSYYSPFTSDSYPAKVKGRGIYFNGNTFLLSESEFSLSVNFSIVILLKIEENHSMPILYFPNYLKLCTSEKTLSLNLTDYTGVISNFVISTNLPLSSWFYLTVIAVPSYKSTSISIYNNKNLLSSATSLGYFRMEGVKFNLGSAQSEFLVGFINALQIYIGVIDLNSYNPIICSSSLITDCIEDCPYMSYFSSSTCQECPNPCSQNCVRSETCNQCDDIGCSKCTSFLSHTCTECHPGYYLSSGDCICQTAEPCLTCSWPCHSCSGPLTTDCVSCSSSSKYLHQGSCLSFCPSPCTSSPTGCICSTRQVFNLRFNQLNSFSNFQGFDLGSNNLDYDQNDPLPQDHRGIYFSKSSYMKSKLVLANEFYFDFWIRVEAQGRFFQKSKFLIEFLDSGLVRTQIQVQNFLVDVETGVWFGRWENFKLKVVDWGNGVQVDWVVNGERKNSTLVERDIFFDDLDDLGFVGNGEIGDDGFVGFVWSLKLVIGFEGLDEDFGTCECTGLGICPVEGTCLSLNEFHFSSNRSELECDEKCITCEFFDVCILCYPQFINNNGICTCPNSLIYNPASKICYSSCLMLQCYPSCLSCDSCESNACTTCDSNLYLLFSTCSICPTGYTKTSDTCTQIFSLVLNQHFKASSDLQSQNQNLNIQSNLPKLLNLRGAYFSHSNFVTSNFSLAPDFAFQIWFFSLSPSGCFLSRQNLQTNSISFQLCIENNNMIITAFYSNSSLSSLSLIEIDSIQWQLFTFWINFESKGIFSVKFSQNLNFIKYSSSHYIYEDLSNSTITVLGGGFAQNQDYFEGFIYKLLFFNAPNFNDFQYFCSESCVGCLQDGTCLSDCGSERSLIDGSCEECGSSDSCFMCGDFLCETCLDIETCAVCKNNSKLQNGKCECLEGFFEVENGTCGLCEAGCKYCDKTQCLECFDGFFLDGNCLSCSQYCMVCNKSECLQCQENYYLEVTSCYPECGPLCKKCSKGKCEHCIANSKLIQNTCTCLQGYEGENCILKLMNLSISISFENNLILNFSEDLYPSLQSSCISITLNSKSLSFHLQSWSSHKYKISFPDNTILNDSNLTLSFSCKLYSINSSELAELSYNLTLHTLKPQNQNDILTVTQSKYQTVAVSTLATVGTISLFNPNLASLWSFLSCMQLLCFIYLFNIPMANSTRGLLLGLRNYMIFPNVFAYLGFNGIDHQFGRAKELGFKDNLVLMNVGSVFSILLSGLVTYFVVKLVERIVRIFSKTRFKVAFKNFFKNYKYSFYLRFWIQNYLEIGIACGISFFSSDLRGLGQAYSFFACCLFSVRFR